MLLLLLLLVWCDAAASRVIYDELALALPVRPSTALAPPTSLADRRHRARRTPPPPPPAWWAAAGEVCKRRNNAPYRAQFANLLRAASK